MNQTKSQFTGQSFKFRAAGAVCAFSLLVGAVGAQAEDQAKTPVDPSPAAATVNTADAAKSADLSTASGAGAESVGKVILKPGQPITINTATEDIQPTDDVELAKRQLEAYPDNAEASFILAVALTRTSRVEEALKEVRHARQLAEDKGGAQYFDKMIATYEKMLTYCPDENRVRYDLAWAYYMKAYLLMQDARRAARDAAPPAAQAAPPPEKGKNVNAAVANNMLSMLSPQLAQNVPAAGKVSSTQLPHIKGALELAPPSVVPQVKQYYESALKNLDDLLAKKPDDIWARIYRAHLYAEYSGDLAGAMKVWHECEKQAPQNPAPYFFLGEGYLKEGNLKESLGNISRAIALRALGN
jgi:tetratricopeptide (TPR) repeat protein